VLITYLLYIYNLIFFVNQSIYEFVPILGFPVNTSLYFSMRLLYLISPFILGALGAASLHYTKCKIITTKQQA